MQFLAAYIMKGRLQAMTVAAALALLSLVFPPASIVSSAAVALVTLRLGAKEGWYVLIFACLAAAILSAVLKVGYQFALLYALLLWMPIWLISIVLREGRQLGIAIEIAVMLGVVAVLGYYWYQPQPAEVWGKLLETMTQAMLQARPDVPVEQITHSARAFAHFMTGAVATGTVYGLLFGLFLARWWQAVLYNPGGFRGEFLALKGHARMAILTILLIAGAGFFDGMVAEVCLNLVLVMTVLYTFIGTAVLHAIFAASKSGRFMVPFLYLTLVAIPHVMVIVALCGLTDHWLNLRKKISNSTAG
ncbi:MAG: hypothetical protein ACU836_00205 [Gammaproteobacteria bacterium]